MAITLNYAITSVIQYLSARWASEKKYATVLGLEQDLLGYYLGGSTAWRLALNLPPEENPDYDFYFQGSLAHPYAVDWLRKNIGRVFQEFLGMTEEQINNKNITKQWVDNDSTNSYYMWTCFWNNIKYDFNIGSLKVYSNFQIRIDVQTGKIAYDPRIPSHEADFKRFAEHDEIITYDFGGLLCDPNPINRLRVLGFVLKSYLKPLGVGKHFSYETAKALVEFKNDPQNSDLILELKERFHVFYKIPPDAIDYIFSIADNCLSIEQQKIIHRLKTQVAQLDKTVESTSTSNEKQKEIDDLKETIKKYQDEIKILSDKNKETLNLASELVKGKEKIITTLEEDKSALQLALTQHEDDKKSLQLTLEKQAKEINSLKSRLGQIQSDLEREKVEVKKLKEQPEKNKTQESLQKELAKVTKEAERTKQSLEAKLEHQGNLIELAEAKEESRFRASVAAYFLIKRCESDTVCLKDMAKVIQNYQIITQKDTAKNNDYRRFMCISGALWWIERPGNANLFISVADTMFALNFPQLCDEHLLLKFFYAILLRIDLLYEYTIEEEIWVIRESLSTLVTSIRAGHLVDNDKIKLNKKLDILQKLADKLLDAEFVEKIKSNAKEYLDFHKVLEKNFTLRSYKMDDKAIEAHLRSNDSELKDSPAIYQRALSNPIQKAILDAYLTLRNKGSLDDFDKILKKKAEMEKAVLQAVLLKPTSTPPKSHAQLFYANYHDNIPEFSQKNHRAMTTLDKHLMKLSASHVHNTACLLWTIAKNKKFAEYECAFAFCREIVASYKNDWSGMHAIWDDFFQENESLTLLGFADHAGYKTLMGNVKRMQVMVHALMSKHNHIKTLMENAQREPNLAKQFSKAYEEIMSILLHYPKPWDRSQIGNSLLLVYLDTDSATHKHLNMAVSLMNQLMPALEEAARHADEINNLETSFRQATVNILNTYQPTSPVSSSSSSSSSSANKKGKKSHNH